MVGIGLRSLGATATKTAAATSLTLPLPDGAKPTDILIAVVVGAVASGSALPTQGPGSPWTLLRSADVPATPNTGLTTYWARGDAPSPVFSSFPANVVSIGWILRYDGTDPTSPIAINGAASGSIGTTITTGGASTSLPGTMVLGIHAWSNTTATIVSAWGVVRRTALFTDSGLSISLATVDSIQINTGNAGSRSVVVSLSSVYMAELVALRPLPPTFPPTTVYLRTVPAP